MFDQNVVVVMIFLTTEFAPIAEKYQSWQIRAGRKKSGSKEWQTVTQTIITVIQY